MRILAPSCRALLALFLVLTTFSNPSAMAAQGQQQEEQEQEQEQDERPIFESEALPAGVPIEIEAYAEFRKGGIFISDGQRVRIWVGTEMLGDEVLNPADVKLGYRFKVEGVRLSDGVIIADKIE